KARKRGKVYNGETAKYGTIGYDEDVHELISVETEFSAIVFDDALTSEVTLLCEPTVTSLNDNEIDFRISFDESDDEDYTENVHTRRTEIRTWNNSREKGKMERKTTRSSRELHVLDGKKDHEIGMATDYCIMKENVHTKRTEIRTWNNSRERGKWKEKTTRSSRELHDKELV
nr:hypothetical protein [Tanacetum cinerariifolium]